jgi:hypothetical protein
MCQLTQNWHNGSRFVRAFVAIEPHRSDCHEERSRIGLHRSGANCRMPADNLQSGRDRVGFLALDELTKVTSRSVRRRCSDHVRTMRSLSHYYTSGIEDEPVKWEVPEFKVGGWTVPPDRWWNDTMQFAETQR